MLKYLSLFCLLLMIHVSTQAQNNTYQWQLDVSANMLDNMHIYQDCANQFKSYIFKNKKKKKILLQSVNYQTDNGKVIVDEAQNKITLIPSNKGEMTVTASKKNKILVKMTFKVLPVPPPTTFLADSLGNLINADYPLPKPDLLKIRAVANETFRYLFPNEINYQVQQVEVFHFRGGRAIKTKKFNSGEIDLKQFSIESGDAFQFKATKIVRMNFENQEMPARIINPYSSIQVK